MKITVDSKSFVEALQWSTKNFDSRDDKSFVTLRVNEHGEGSVSHENTTSFLKSNFTVLESEVEAGSDDFILPLQGQFVQRLANTLDSTGPSVLVYQNDTLKLKNKLGNFTVPTLKSKVKADPDIKIIGTVDNVAYFDALQRLAKLCDPASAGFYPVLGTVDLSFDFDNDTATLMATDRYTLGEIVIDFTPAADGQGVLGDKANLLLPYSAAVLIAPSKGALLETELVYEDNSGKFGYAFADGRVAIFSLQEAEALAYASLKTSAASNTENHVQVPTKELQKAIGVISSLVPDENEIYLTLSDGSLIVTDTNKTNQLAVDVEASGVEEEQTVKFIRSVVNKAFAPIATSNMNLKWENVSSAFIFEPILDDGAVSENVFVLAIPSS